MVLKFLSNKTNPPTLIYMGRDKDENELLIRWGWPEDVWFHMDKLSSAHVYMRLQRGQTLDDIAPDLLIDCAQLVKANSIEGCKQSNVDVVYTLWSNLRKTGDMAVGQIGFHNNKAVMKIRIEKKSNEVINRLNRTKISDDNFDYRGAREKRDAEVRQKEKEEQRQKRAAEAEERARTNQAQAEASYDTVFAHAEMTTNENGYDSDDFM